MYAGGGGGVIVKTPVMVRGYNKTKGYLRKSLQRLYTNPILTTAKMFEFHQEHFKELPSLTFKMKKTFNITTENFLIDLKTLWQILVQTVFIVLFPVSESNLEECFLTSKL